MIEFEYKVRPADPHDRRDHPDAHDVLGPHALVGVWETERAATEIAAALNNRAGEQIR